MFIKFQHHEHFYCGHFHSGHLQQCGHFHGGYELNPNIVWTGRFVVCGHLLLNPRACRCFYCHLLRGFVNEQVSTDFVSQPLSQPPSVKR